MSAQEFLLTPKEKLHQESIKSVQNSGRSNNYSKKSTTYVITTSSRKKGAREGENVSRGESPRDTGRYPEKGTSLNHNAQSSSN